MCGRHLRRLRDIFRFEKLAYIVHGKVTSTNRLKRTNDQTNLMIEKTWGLDTN